MIPHADRPPTHIVVLALMSFAFALHGCSSNDNDDPPPDTTAPTVSVNALPATVNRSVTINATANDNVGVTQVEFRVDGTVISTDTSAPFSASWDTGTVAEGAHSITARASDAASNATTSSAVDVTVSNQVSFAVTLSGLQENPANASNGAAAGTIDVNLISGAATGAITTSGFTVTAAHIHDGFAGTNGPIVVGLEQDTANPADWRLPANTVLTSAHLDRLIAGALYVNAHSAAFPAGEVRAQLVPAHVRVLFTNLTTREEPAFVDASGSARGALTVDTNTRAIVAHVQLTGIDAPTEAHIHQGFAGVDGPVSVALRVDPADAAHYFEDNATLSQAAFDALLAGGLYFNVHTTANPTGHVRGQLAPDNIIVNTVDLDGVQEVPAVSSTGRARAAVTFNRDTRAVHIHLNSQGLDDATAAHLHRGVAGTNGGIAVGLTQDGSNPAHWLIENGTIEQADMDALLIGRTYVNIHTPANPGGELRGQVAPPGVLVIVNAMSGDQEVPVQATTAAGSVAVTVDTTTGATETHVNASGVDDAVAAHVHTGFAGLNGPVLIGLTKDTDPQLPGHWFSTDGTLSSADIDVLRAGGLYANVHTPAAPGGLIRGQLLTPDVQLIFTDLTGGEEVPPVTTTATARAATTVDTVGSVLTIYVNTTNLATANAAHIHRAPPGENGPIQIGLTQDSGTPSRWSAAGVVLTTEQMGDYVANLWYVNVHTPANPGGEIRGQIVPNPGPAPDTEAPSVTLGAVAATLTGTVALTATATDNVGVATVRFKVNGTVVGSDTTEPYSFDWNSTTVANGAVTVSAEAVDAAGNTGTSADAAATVSNPTGPTAFTFTEIQTQIFSVSCAASGCHSGGSPQAGMNLSAGVSYSNIVNVASSEVPSLMRVAPGSASDSYLIRKLEGAPGIVGARMPFGGPFLDQPTIDRIRAWIDSGAPNN